MRNYTILSPIMNKSLLVLFFCAFIGITSCKKDDPEPVRYTNIMFVNAIPDAAALDLYIDDNKKSGPVAFGSSTTYHTVESGPHKITVTEAATITKKFEFSQGFEGDKNYSVFATNTLSQPQSLVLIDTAQSPAAGKAWVRFLNLSNDTNASYFIQTNSGDFQFAAQSFKKSSGYKEYDAGSYDFKVVDANTGPVSDPPAVSFQGGKVYTLVLYGSNTNTSINLLTIGKEN